MNKPYKVYDCFKYMNEAHILEMRLNILNDVVDYFVLVESTYTHAGKPKPLYFNRDDFPEFKDKIIHIVVDDAAHYATNGNLNEKQGLENDAYQRNAIMRGLVGLEENDRIIVADVDEIPNPDTLLNYNPDDYFSGELVQNFYYYFLNMCAYNGSKEKKTTAPATWIGPKITSWEFLRTVFGSPNNLRFRLPKKKPARNYISKFLYRRKKSKLKKNAQKIESGGWHFSFLMSPSDIKEKIESYCHTQYDKKEFKKIEHIKQKITSGEDLFNRSKHTYKKVPIDETYPIYLRNNIDKYSAYIAD